MRIQIFTEGGRAIGLGHLSRCYSLYEEALRQKREVHLTYQGDATDVVFLKGPQITHAQWRSQAYIEREVDEHSLCIVDSYLADASVLKAFSDRAKAVFFIDDYNRLPYPKGTVVQPFLSKAPPSKTVLTGQAYIILRRPFVGVNRVKTKRVAHRVLVMMGGTDSQNLIPRLLDGVVKRFPEIEFHFVIGGGTLPVEAANAYGHCNLSAEEMKAQMLSCDFALSAAGQTVFELMATQTPFIPIQVADNQQANIRGILMTDPTHWVLNCNAPDFESALEAAFRAYCTPALRQRLSELYRGVIDGRGAQRIVEALWQKGL